MATVQMPGMIRVYPTKASAMNVRHHGMPHANKGYPHPVDGAWWPDDGFTARLITEGSFTTDATKAWKPGPVKDGKPKDA